MAINQCHPSEAGRTRIKPVYMLGAYSLVERVYAGSDTSCAGPMAAAVSAAATVETCVQLDPEAKRPLPLKLEGLARHRQFSSQECNQTLTNVWCLKSLFLAWSVRVFYKSVRGVGSPLGRVMMDKIR